MKKYFMRCSHVSQFTTATFVKIVKRSGNCDNITLYLKQIGSY